MELIAIHDSANGIGMFAKSDIPTGTVLLRISGQTITFDATKLLGDRESYCLQIAERLYLYPDPPFYYSNHSCEPNCGINQHMEFITLEPIAAGQELRWDYSTSMMERSWEIACDCGSKRCRKRIRDFDTLPESIRQEYLRKQVVMPYIVKLLKV